MRRVLLTLLALSLCFVLPCEAAPTNGPRFHIGWYDAATHPETAARVADQGIDLLVPYVSTLDLEAITAYVDAAEAAGLSVILEVPRIAVRSGDAAAIKRFVQSFQRSSVIGWYLFDEPDRTAGMSPAIIQAAYGLLRDADPLRPVSLALVESGAISTYADACDAIWYDYYPIAHGTRDFAGLRGQKFRQRLQQMTGMIRATDREPWLVLQGYGEDSTGKAQYGRRLPSAGEMRYMIYTALLQQPAGILFWTHYRTREEWVGRVLAPLVREVRRLVPDDLRQFPAPAITSSRTTLQLAVLGSTGGARYLVAVHHGERKDRIQIHSDREMTMSEIGGRREVLGRNTTLEFERFQVRVFELLP